jgi:ABC-type transport system substrate-binding protein
MLVLRSALLAPVALVILIAGCGAGSNPDPNELVIHSVLPAKVGTLDPANIETIYEFMVAGQIFEPLYGYHYLKRPYEVVPLLADGMPQVNDCLLTYTVKIKKGVYFQDDPCFRDGKGRELTASDFVYSYKRIANIKNYSKNWWIFEDKIVGLDEFREYTKTCVSEDEVDYSRPVEGLQAPDSYTLVMKLKKPWPQLIYVLAFQGAAVAKEAVDYYRQDIISHPVGTGPFMLKTWQRGSFINLVRNPHFRQEYYPSEGEHQDAEKGLLDDAGKPIPFVDRVIFRIIEEDQPCWFLFLRGQIDNITIPKDNFGQAMRSMPNGIGASRELTPAMKERNIHLDRFGYSTTIFIGFNMEDQILGPNKPLREAISFALDRAKYIEIFWNGRDEVANGLIPPVINSYNPDIKKIGQRYDPEKARQLIKQAQEICGGKIPTLTLSMPGTDTLKRQIGQFWQRCLKEVGLDVEVEYLDLATFLDKTRNKGSQMFYTGCWGDYPDAANFLQLFYGKNVSPGVNSFNYVNPEFDKLYEKASCMPDCPEKTQVYQQAEEIVIRDCPAAFVNHPVEYMLYHDWLGNYKPHAFQYGLAKYYKIDKKKRDSFKELLKKIE